VNKICYAQKLVTDCIANKHDLYTSICGKCNVMFSYVYTNTSFFLLKI